ncbi:MAG TPA: polyphosphate polymerase domain-containing protein [Candidatus Paceibacterota bacterium]
MEMDTKAQNKKEDKKEEEFARLEFKYVLDPLIYMQVRSFIESIGLEHDRSVLGGLYTVTSIYFDTIGLDDYYDTAGGFLDRKKLRVRIYDREFDSKKEIHFEVKNKHDMFILKDRVTVVGKEWQDLLRGDFRKFSKVFDGFILSEGRTPTVIVRYEREAYDSWFHGRVRLTFDRKIEAIRPDSLVHIDELWYDVNPVYEEYANEYTSSPTVLEIKFGDKLPWWFSFMVRKFDLQRSVFSKYSRSIDALYKHDPLPR